MRCVVLANPRSLVLAATMMMLWAAPLLAGQVSWDFQSREEAGWSFSEGIKGAPVSGHQVGIELLSVESISDSYQAKRGSSSDRVLVRFCQPESFEPSQGHDVHLTFKELQDFEHYVLSGATKKKSKSIAWTKGCQNIFPWATKLAKSIVGDLDNIGVVVEVDQRERNIAPYVVPVFLYGEHHPCPQQLTGYRIVLRSTRGGGITTRILDQDNKERLKVDSRLKGGMPVSINWNLDRRVAEGWYRIEVQGVDNSISLSKKILHRNACRE